MEGFQVTEIGEKIYCILDAGNSSFYVVEGEEKAAVIDTGITAGAKILPVIRELTDKPLLLVITHAHPDHLWGAIDDFDSDLFPNASSMISEAEWAFWSAPDVFAKLPEDRQAFGAGARAVDCQRVTARSVRRYDTICELELPRLAPGSDRRAVTVTRVDGFDNESQTLDIVYSPQ